MNDTALPRSHAPRRNALFATLRVGFCKRRRASHAPVPKQSVGTRLGVTCLLLFAGQAFAEPPQVYRAARIWPGNAAPINNAVLVVQDGKIVDVGPRDKVKEPDNANIHDLGSAVLIPGLVIAETALGGVGRDDERTLTPEYRAIDGFDFYADYSNALAGGVTTVQVSPGLRRLLPGQGAVVKLAGDEVDPRSRTLRERESLRILLGDAFKNPPRIYEPPVGAVSVDKPLEPTRQQLAASLGSAVAGLRATLRAAQGYGKSSSSPRDHDLSLATIAEYVNSSGRIRITAPGAADIRAALSLAHEFNLQILLVDPANLAPFREQLSGWRGNVAGVILNADVRPGTIAEQTGDRARETWKNARDLLAAGLKVAIRPAADGDLNDILFAGGLFTRGGLSPQEVLKMLTVTPAEMLGVADRVGSLAAGMDADFVVLGDNLLASHAPVRQVYVNGRLAFEAKTKPQATVIQAARVYTGSGYILTQGSVLVQGTTVRGLGRDVSVPPDAKVRRYERAVIVPGFLDLSTGLGLGGPLASAVPLQTKLGDQLVSSDTAIGVARQGGVTTVLLASSAPTPSPVLAFKLSDTPRVVQEPVAIRFGITGNLTSQAATLRTTLGQARSYAEVWNKYQLAQAAYEKSKQEYDAKVKAAPPAKPAETEKEKKEAAAKKPAETDKDKKEAAAKKPEEKGPAAPTPPSKPTTVEAMEPYRALFSGKIPAFVDAHRADAIKLALEIFRDEFKVRVVLLGADDAFRMADVLAEKQVAVAVGPELVRTVDRAPINLAQILANRGIPFGFRSNARTGVKTLPLAVQYAVHRGLGANDALTALTSVPARLLALDKVGTLAVGKDADLVVLSGPPFEPSTRVLAVMIDGKWVYEEKDEG